jgi:hypothetical protein
MRVGARMNLKDPVAWRIRFYPVSPVPMQPDRGKLQARPEPGQFAYATVSLQMASGTSSLLSERRNKMTA